LAGLACQGLPWHRLSVSPSWRTRTLTALQRQENFMVSEKGPNIKKKQKCKNCEGKGLLKKGDKVVKCQRCKGTGVR
jgi:DnaJ-class molecular chaperone